MMSLWWTNSQIWWFILVLAIGRELCLMLWLFICKMILNSILRIPVWDWFIGWDKDTSGLLVIAKNENAKTHLGKQFLTKRLPAAIMHWYGGDGDEDESTVDGDIGRDPRDRMLLPYSPMAENPRYRSTQLPLQSDRASWPCDAGGVPIGDWPHAPDTCAYETYWSYSFQWWGVMEVMSFWEEPIREIQTIRENCFDICPDRLTCSHARFCTSPYGWVYEFRDQSCLPIWRSLLTNGEPTLLVVILREEQVKW